MVRCNLAKLLEERNLKITKVSKDTGISRTTLTSLAKGHSKGFSYDVLDSLCYYLKVGIGELLVWGNDYNIPNVIGVCSEGLDDLVLNSKLSEGGTVTNFKVSKEKGTEVSFSLLDSDGNRFNFNLTNKE